MNTTDLISSAAAAVWGDLPDGSSANRRAHLDVIAVQVNQHVPRLNDQEEARALAGLMADLSIALNTGAKFLPGEVRKSPGLSDLSQKAALGLMKRHLAGDWGDLPEDDKAANEVALANGGRILSCYVDVHDGDAFWTKIWILTDGDVFGDEGPVSRVRMATLLLLPSEY